MEDAWKEVIKRVAYDDLPDHSLNEVAMDLAEKGAIPSAAETLVPYDKVQYIARDVGAAERLPEALAERVALPWYYGRKSDHSEAINQLTTLLDATRLKEEYDRNVVIPSHQPTETTLGERYRLLLDVGNSLLADRDEDNAQELLEEVADYTVQTAETVRCEYRLGGNLTTVDETIYVDQDEEHVYIAEGNASRLKLVEVIAAALELTGPTRNKFIELVQGAAGKDEDLIDAYLDSRDIPYERIKSPPPEVDRATDDGEETDMLDEEEGAEDNDISNLHEDGVSGNDDAIRPADTTDEEMEAPAPNTGRVDPRPSRSEPTDETGPKDGSDQSSESIIDIGSSSGEDPDRETRAGSGGLPFGETGEAQETGDAGELLVLKHLRNLFEAELNNTEVTTRSDTRSNAYRVEGYSDGREVTVTLKKVPDRETPHSDLLVDGASLTRQGHEFEVDEVASDKQTFVEVKSSKNETKAFRITKPEHEEAQGNPEYLIARPIEVGSEDERIETVFDTVPRVRVRTESSGRLEVDDLELEYQGMWVSY